MDKLQWFKFSYADWRMGKIQKCPEVTQARFMNLCCLYWSKESNLSYEDAEIEIDKEHLDILLSKKIIEQNDEFIIIKFLDEQLEGIAETSKGKSKAAKARWDKYREDKESKEQKSTDAMHVHTDAMQNNAEKSRGEEIREEKKRKDKPPTAFNFRNSFLNLGVNNDILNDWLDVRKKRKSANSKTAFSLFINEVGKSKLSVSDAVELCAGKSWASFNHKWELNLPIVKVENPNNEEIVKYKDNVGNTGSATRSKYEEMVIRNHEGGYIYTEIK